MGPDDVRLNRIEGKVDSLVETMAKLLMFEDRLRRYEERMQRFEFREDDLEERLEVIEKRMPLLNLLLGGTGKIALAVLTAAVLAALGSVFII